MKRKLQQDNSKQIKKPRLKVYKRGRSIDSFNLGGASDDEEVEHPVVKKMMNSLKDGVVMRRCYPFQKIDIRNVPTYIN